MIRGLIKATVQLLIVLVLLSACASLRTDRISDYFEVTYTGLRFDLYHVGTDGTREYLGSMQRDDVNNAFFASPRGEFSEYSDAIVSPDGTRFVYFHNSNMAHGRSDKQSGIYFYEHGSGDQLLYRSEEYRIRSGSMHHKPLPEHTISIVLKNSEYGPSKRQTPTLITTDGIGYPAVLHLASPLHTAAYYGNADDVRTLLAEGALIDEQTYWGNTALEIAIIRGNEESALQLIEGGANLGEPMMVFVRSHKRFIRPIHLASALPSTKVMDAILSKGVDVDLTDSHGATPIHFVVEGRVPVSYTGLWGYTRNFNRDSQKWDQYNIAKRTALEFLIGKGAQLDAKDAGGLLPLDYALRIDHYRTARPLIEAMEGTEIQIENIEALHRIVRDLLANPFHREVYKYTKFGYSEQFQTVANEIILEIDAESQ